MKQICELNDKLLLGIEGLSNQPPRRTARAIVRDSEGKYAVMYAEKFNLYSLPGGGIEAEEDVLTALRREVLEETGCVCDDIQELGIVTENRRTLDYTQVNYYYVVTAKRAGESHLTKAEQASRTSVQWHTLEDMIRMIENQHFARIQGKYLVARDVAALHEYISKMRNNTSTLSCI